MSAVYGRERVALLTAAEAAALDDRARDDNGVPGRALMENAGRAAAQVVHRLYPTGRVVAVVGSGNNGGDAIVALRSLHAWGRDVAYLRVGSSAQDPSRFTGFDLPRIDDPADAAFAGAAVLIDGILGTGASGAPREPAATVIRRMNASGTPIVAFDIPTGVDPSTGAIAGEAVEAAVTIQFGWPKTGALFQPGRARCGRLVAVEIGFPPLADDEGTAALITPDWARARLPARAPDAHKNSVGRVTLVAGRKGMAGAAAIAGVSAMRAGAGYARVVSAEANRTIIQTAVPEALFVDRSDLDAVREAVTESDAVLIGPAIGTGDEGSGLLDAVLDAREDRGLVLDADALTILAGRDGGLSALGGRAIATPHPGEMRRLIDRSVPEIRDDPMGAARHLAERTGVVVLLKGAPSVVAAPGRPVLVAAIGSSDLATAAMGDQLGGEIAAFLAAGAHPADAAGLGLFYGGRAAELAGRGRSLTPHDIAERIHQAFDDPGPPASDLDLPFVVFDQPPRW
ncbi:MAG: NAD(P)H-hydrate dehydratase [Gemmatimonadota bacterium]